jgi:hypothetical protein
MIYLCIGRRELGKTTLAYRMCRNVRRRFVLDARRMIVQHGQHVETTTDAVGTEDTMYAVAGGELEESIYQPREAPRIAFEYWTGALRDLVVEYPRMEIAVLVDEASFYDLDDDSFQWLVKCAPRSKVHVLITAHQPKDIPTSIRSIADHWFVFYTTQQTDLDRIEEKSPDAARLVRSLQGRDYVHWDDARAKLTVNRYASNWFIPLEGVANDGRDHSSGSPAATA